MKNILKNLKVVTIVGGVMSLGLVSTAALADHKSHGSGYANSGCSKFEVSTYGGDGGIRFMHDVNNFVHAKNGSQYGKICKGGYVTVELAKRHPGTKVAFHINGQGYYFGAHEHAHKYQNNWHRKYVKIHLPQGYRNHNYGQKSYSHNNYPSKRPYDNYNNGGYNNNYSNHSYNYGYNNGYNVYNKHRKHKRHANKHRQHHYGQYGYNNSWGYNKHRNKHYKKHRDHYGYNY